VVPRVGWRGVRRLDSFNAANGFDGAIGRSSLQSMSGLSSARLIVVGAGAIGSAVAVVLAQAGARVTLIDSAAPGDNASGVAAGMLAPAFEALLDPPSRGHFALLREARALWPGFAERLGGADIGLRASGALWIDDAAGLEARERELAGLGARCERMSRARLMAMAPDLGADAGEGLFSPEDWLLDAEQALAALAHAAALAGVETLTQTVTAIEDRAALLADGRRLVADAIVLATGAEQTALAPELVGLTAIKGHILKYPSRGLTPDGPVVRRPGGYGVIGRRITRVGATMQTGEDDRAIEPAQVVRLHALAATLFPALATVASRPAVGVRATTADGLPMVGPSRRPGVFLAVGARRNGWLLAPMVAAMTAAMLAGEDPGGWAASFDPRRFD
jgi:glycine oxidase